MGDSRDHEGLPRSFFDLVETSEKPVLVDFWAEWCGPCRMVSPAVERVAGELSGRVLTVKVNVDRKPDVAGRYGIQGIPTLMLFHHGNVLMRLVGAHPYEEIRRSVLEALR